MSITRETIEKRMESLEAERTQLIAKIQAITGALQDCAFWLAQVEETKNTKEENQ
jgi:hypothetical protein